MQSPFQRGVVGGLSRLLLAACLDLHQHPWERCGGCAADEDAEPGAQGRPQGHSAGLADGEAAWSPARTGTAPELNVQVSPGPRGCFPG